jgi:hypothetical protein
VGVMNIVLVICLVIGGGFGGFGHGIYAR